MLKLLIVDDEPNICKLIKNLIDWEAFSGELALFGQAEDGEQALDILKQNLIDIVITDIRMPGMNGLELIKRAYDEGFNTMFVVISGYKEFEYALNAIKYGVQDYLIKPIDQVELNQLLRKLIDMRTGQMELHETMHKVEETLEERTSQLKENELSRALFEAGYTPDASLFCPEKCPCDLFVIKIDFMDNNQNTGAHRIVLDKLCKSFMEKFSRLYADFAYTISESYAYILAGSHKDEAAGFSSKLSEVRQFVRDHAPKYEGYEITIGADNAMGDIRDIHDTANLIKKAIRQRIVLGAGSVINADPYKDDCDDITLCDDIIRQIRRGVESLNAEDTVEIVKQFFSSGILNDPSEYYKFYPAAKAVVELVGSSIVAFGLLEQAELPIGIIQAQQQIDNFNRVKDISRYTDHFIRQAFEACLQSRINLTSKPIRDAKQYVLDNISRQPSLEEVAALVHMSPNYFSNLFKSKTGVSFRAFVIRERINESKRLLRETNLSIQGIADRVGYTDARHFSKLFIKQVGIKPTEYRKHYSR